MGSMRTAAHVAQRMLTVPNFRNFRVLRVSTEVPKRPGSYAVKRLHFELMKHTALTQVDASKGHSILLRPWRHNGESNAVDNGNNAGEAAHKTSDAMIDFLDIQGRNDKYGEARSYTPVSPPDQKDTVELLVKIYDDRPGMSRFVGNLKAGDSVQLARKKYTRAQKQKDLTATHIGVICFGIGITKALPVVKAELERGAEVSLLWANRHPLDLVLVDTLAAVAEKFKDRCRIQYTYSQWDGSLVDGLGHHENDQLSEQRELHARDPLTLHHGAQRRSLFGQRPSPELLRTMYGAWIADPSILPTLRFFCVGSKSMIADGWTMLGELGVGDRQVFDFFKVIDKDPPA